MDERVEYDGRIERFSFKLRKTRAVTHNTIIFDLKQFWGPEKNFTYFLLKDKKLLVPIKKTIF